MDKSVLFSHHARGCTIVAAKIYKNILIYQNVTIGSNMRYNRTKKRVGECRKSDSCIECYSCPI